MLRLTSRATPFRRQLSTLVHGLLAASIAGCAAGDGTQDTTAAAGGDAFRVALLTPGPISDQSWNGGAYAGLQRIRDSLGAQVSHIQTRTPAEFEENFRQYGAQGYDLVFGHGFEFQDAAVRVAPQHPRTFFVTTSGNQVRENVAGMTFAFEESSYLAGMVAGALWAGIAGVLKARTGAHEVIVTIMLNAIALRLAEWVINSRSPRILLDLSASVPHTVPIHEAARMPRLWPGTPLHIGFLLALLLCALVWFLCKDVM